MVSDRRFKKVIFSILFTISLAIPLNVQAEWGAPFCDIDTPDQFQKAVDVYDSGVVDFDTKNAHCNVIRVRKGMTIKLPKGLFLRDKPADFGLEIRPCYADSTYKGDGCTDPVGDDAVVLDFSDHKDACPIRVRHGAEALIKKVRLIVRGDKFKAICQEGSLTPIYEGDKPSPYVTKLEKLTIDVAPEEVKPPPPPSSPLKCKLSQTPVKEGVEYDLDWETEGASSVTFQEGFLDAEVVGASGSRRVKPKAITTYTLTVKRGVEKNECQVTLRPKPTCSLTSEKLSKGYRLNWKATAATKVTLKDDSYVGPGGSGLDVIFGKTLYQVEPSGMGETVGSQVVIPEFDTTYTLTAKGPGGICNEKLPLEPNNPLPPPPTCTFSAEARPTGGYDLKWVVTGEVTDVTVKNETGGVILSKVPSGGHSVYPDAPTTYTLTAKGPGGVCHGSHILTLSALPPKPVGKLCEFFTATPASGGGFDLTWSTKDATKVEVTEEGNPTPLSKDPKNPTPPPNVKPAKTTTYSLRAEDKWGKSCQIDFPLSPALKPIPPQPDCNLDRKVVGSGYELTWTTKGATKVTLGEEGAATPLSTVASSDPKAPLIVTPKTTTNYVLKAENEGGVCRSKLPLDPVPVIPPEISCELKTSPVAGGGFELTWSTKEATSSSLSDGSPTPVSTALTGKQNVNPTTTTTYTLTAKRAGVRDCERIAILSPPPPPPPLAPACLSLTTDLPAADGGVALKWETKNAKKVTLTEGALSPKEVEKSGGAKVTPTSPTTYKISATGDGEPCSMAITVAPEKKDPPTGEGPSCDLKGETQAGGGFALIWSTKGAVTIALSDGSSTTPLSTAASGRLDVRPPAPTLYTLTAVNADGNCVSKLTLSPGALSGGILPPPPTCNLSSTVASGGGFDLVWSSTGATTVIFGDGAVIPLSTSPSGRINVKPATAVTYTVTATGAGGSCSRSLFPADLSLSFVEGGGMTGGCSLVMGGGSL